MRRFFYDTEFIEDGTTIDLVSIGVVDETGREFYAVSTEFDPDKAIPWVRRNVLDQLPPPADKAWRSRERIREELLAFLTGPGEEIELWAWFGAYDHVALCQLWGAMPAPAPADPAVHPRAAAALGRPGPAGAAAEADRDARRAGRRPLQPGAVAGDGGPAAALMRRLLRTGRDRRGMALITGRSLQWEHGRPGSRRSRGRSATGRPEPPQDKRGQHREQDGGAIGLAPRADGAQTVVPPATEGHVTRIAPRPASRRAGSAGRVGVPRPRPRRTILRQRVDPHPGDLQVLGALLTSEPGVDRPPKRSSVLDRLRHQLLERRASRSSCSG